MEQETIRRINHLAEELEGVYHEFSLFFGLSDSTSIILYTLRTRGGSCPLGELVKTCGACRQTVHSALHKLERDGILTVRAENRKRQTVSLTPAGTELAERTVDRLIAAENAVFADWKKEEREQYIRLMRRFLNELKEKTKNMRGVGAKASVKAPSASTEEL